MAAAPSIAISLPQKNPHDPTKVPADLRRVSGAVRLGIVPFASGQTRVALFVFRPATAECRAQANIRLSFSQWRRRYGEQY